MNFEQLAAIERNYAEQPIIQTIAPDDEMWPGGESWYFDVGKFGVSTVLHSLSLSRLQNVRHILDLPCGHGRVGRHLRAAFPDARLTFCDLNRSGVDFCSQMFRGNGVYSRVELTDVEFETKFDVIWIGSLFTHVDADRAGRWMRHLCKMLSPNGVLLATFHGFWQIEIYTRDLIREAEWAEILSEFRRTGWGYARYPGLAADFGISLSHPSRVMDLACVIDGVRVISYVERGWANNHDVLTLAATDRKEPY